MRGGRQVPSVRPRGPDRQDTAISRLRRWRQANRDGHRRPAEPACPGGTGRPGAAAGSPARSRDLTGPACGQVIVTEAYLLARPLTGLVPVMAA